MNRYSQNYIRGIKWRHSYSNIHDKMIRLWLSTLLIQKKNCARKYLTKCARCAETSVNCACACDLLNAVIASPPLISFHVHIRIWKVVKMNVRCNFAIEKKWKSCECELILIQLFSFFFFCGANKDAINRKFIYREHLFQTMSTVFHYVFYWVDIEHYLYHDVDTQPLG